LELTREATFSGDGIINRISKIHWAIHWHIRVLFLTFVGSIFLDILRVFGRIGAISALDGKRHRTSLAATEGKR